MRSRSKRRSTNSTKTPDHQHQQHRQRRTQGPVLRVGEGDFDIVDDGDHRLTAQDLRLGDGAHGQDEGEQAADDQARHRQRQLDLIEHLPPVGAEIGGGFDGFPRHHGHAQGHGKQHERQIDVHHPEDRHRRREQPAIRLDAEQMLERAQEHAVLDEEQDPAIEPEILRNEERQHEDERDGVRPSAEHFRQPIGERIAEQRQDHDRDGGQGERPGERLIERLGEYRPVVLQAGHLPQRESARGCKAERDNRQQGRGEADQQQRQQRQRMAPPGDEPARKPVRIHCTQSATSMLSAAFQPISTSSSRRPPIICCRSVSTTKTCSPTRTWNWIRLPSAYSL